jgi:hypothetical protein
MSVWNLFNKTKKQYEENMKRVEADSVADCVADSDYDCDCACKCKDTIEEEGFLWCSDCGKQQNSRVFHNEFDAFDRVCITSSYNYDKVRRFENILDQLVGYERQKFKDHIWELIKSGDYKDHKSLRLFLKREKLQRFSPSINLILCNFGLYTPIKITQTQRIRILDIFSEFEKTWKEEGNFPNNHILIYKILHKIGIGIEVEELSCLKIVKTEDARIDKILDNIHI